MNKGMKRVGVILFVGISVAIGMRLVVSSSDFSHKLKRIVSNSVNIELCQVKVRMATQQCKKIDKSLIVDLINGGNSTLPPSKVKIEKKSLLVFSDMKSNKSCFSVVEYEDKSLSLIINDIKPLDGCIGVDKYLGAYYAIENSLN